MSSLILLLLVIFRVCASCGPVIVVRVRQTNKPGFSFDDIVNEAIMFSSVRRGVRPFFHLFVLQILLPRCLLNGLSSLDETYRECSLALLMT